MAEDIALKMAEAQLAALNQGKDDLDVYALSEAELDVLLASDVPIPAPLPKPRRQKRAVPLTADERAEAMELLEAYLNNDQETIARLQPKRDAMDAKLEAMRANRIARKAEAKAQYNEQHRAEREAAALAKYEATLEKARQRYTEKKEAYRVQYLAKRVEILAKRKAAYVADKEKANPRKACPHCQKMMRNNSIRAHIGRWHMNEPKA